MIYEYGFAKNLVEHHCHHIVVHTCQRFGTLAIIDTATFG